jgi:Flp pilus assembly secretin CpaC
MQMVVGVAVVVTGVCAGMAQEKKPADPFIKGAKPAVVTAKGAVGEAATESPIEVMKRIIIPQIEIEVQFVAFDSTNVEKLVATGRLNVDTLTNLWINGGGHLLAAPRVRTPAGQEAVVKNVIEYIYPTTFSVSNEDNAGTNNASMTDTHTSAAVTVPKRMVRSPVVVPGGFETREVGTILQVLPEVSPDGMIVLTMSPQMVVEPVLHDYGSKYVDASGKEQQARMEQPFFPVISLSTSVSLRDGQRILIGGGRPWADGKEVVYIFVSARIVGTEADGR